MTPHPSQRGWTSFPTHFLFFPPNIPTGWGWGRKLYPTSFTMYILLKKCLFVVPIIPSNCQDLIYYTYVLATYYACTTYMILAGSLPVCPYNLFITCHCPNTALIVATY